MYVTPKEWCMNVRQLRRELTRLHRELGNVPQDAVVLCDNAKCAPMRKFSTHVGLMSENRICLWREVKTPKLTKKRRREIAELNRRAEEMAKQDELIPSI